MTPRVHPSLLSHAYLLARAAVERERVHSEVLAGRRRLYELDQRRVKGKRAAWEVEKAFGMRGIAEDAKG
jgi:hypothetical protein